MGFLTEVLLQTLYYAVVMGLAIFFISFILRGFFWKFLKVKISFGRLILVKIRGINRDYFAVGEIEENFLVYKDPMLKKQEKRINIKDNKAFYKVLGITAIDVDNQTNNVCYPDYTVVEGFDSAKYNNLYLRALYTPQITDNKDKLIIVLLVLILLASLGAVYMGYNSYNMATINKEMIKTVADKIPTIISGGRI